MGSSGRRCSYHMCTKSGRNTPGLRRFKFPITNPTILQQWIVNSGNSELINLSADKLKCKFICSDHFVKEMILGKNLAKGAVPLPFSQVVEIEARSKGIFRHYSKRAKGAKNSPSSGKAQFETQSCLASDSSNSAIQGLVLKDTELAKKRKRRPSEEDGSKGEYLLGL